MGNIIDGTEEGQGAGTVIASVGEKKVKGEPKNPTKQDTLPPKSKGLKKAKLKNKDEQVVVSAIPQRADVLLKGTESAPYHKTNSFFYATDILAKSLVGKGWAVPAENSEVDPEELKQLRINSGLPALGAVEQEDEDED